MTTKKNVIWITGASMGIGRALALELASRGHTVIASARSEDKLTTLVEESASLPGSIHAYPLDVTHQQAVNDAVAAIQKDFSTIDQAILNAGTFLPMQGNRFKADVIKQQFDLNVFGVSYCLEALIPVMKQQKQGLLAINASLAGYRGLPKSAAYGATKAALINMAECLKLDLDREGIDVKVINPGFVKTPLTDKNDFHMPFLVDSEQAARVISDGLARSRFEIRFPTLFAGLLGLLKHLPYRCYFALVKRAKI
ncbi:oxidoreductase [Endozoicomonas montiporae]|uniref:Oxidoreductase n=2 Tax=Endozoicomonas montiporae TaxID=1027273 RepID=A0A081N4L5_9GAMM|nr:SDR family NAD(P)-dependent oxidoreductase [Endozoicomonas montiporae]AMO57747.1 short-chain dehydrogenase/reductase sDR [Endozoicomonas montiporae CL-33]KEQ13388.1 oxidoreductase [Endozoicomonas montiporae]